VVGGCSLLAFTLYAGNPTGVSSREKRRKKKKKGEEGGEERGKEGGKKEKVFHEMLEGIKFVISDRFH